MFKTVISVKNEALYKPTLATFKLALTVSVHQSSVVIGVHYQERIEYCGRFQKCISIP